MSNIIPMNYDDRSFPFASDCWFNATVAAKHHGRKVTEWLRLPSTKEYMAELCQELGIEGFNFKGGIFPPLVRIEKGRYGGTWLHPELAVEFARWLSVKFARACDRHIKNLLLSKNFQLTEDQIVGLMVCQQPTSWEKRFKDPFYAEENNSNAQYMLGTIYNIGSQGVIKNSQKSAYWLERSVKSGNETALFLTAMNYWYGWGVNKDPVKAYAYLLVAQSFDNEHAKKQDVEFRYAISQEQREEAEEMAIAIKKKHFKK